MTLPNNKINKTLKESNSSLLNKNIEKDNDSIENPNERHHKNKNSQVSLEASASGIINRILDSRSSSKSSTFLNDINIHVENDRNERNDEAGIIIKRHNKHNSSSKRSQKSNSNNKQNVNQNANQLRSNIIFSSEKLSSLTSEKLSSLASSNRSLNENKPVNENNHIIIRNQEYSRDKSKNSISTSFNQENRSEQLSMSYSNNEIGKTKKKIIRSVKQIRSNNLKSFEAKSLLPSQSLTIINDSNVRKALSKNKLDEKKFQKLNINATKPNNLKLIDNLVDRKRKYDSFMKEKQENNAISIIDYNKKYYYITEHSHYKLPQRSLKNTSLNQTNQSNLSNKVIKPEKHISSKSNRTNRTNRTNKSNTTEKYNFKEDFSYVIVNDDKNNNRSREEIRKKSPSIERYEALLRCIIFYYILIAFY